MSDVLVSVMVPSRNRTQLLEKSLQSLIATADLDIGKQIEIIVRYDDDDKTTEKWLADHPDMCTLTVHGPRGNGYADLHKMYNEMSAQAQGRFLFLWNDDAIMLTPGWDVEISRHDSGKPCYLYSSVSDGRGKDAFLFPIVHRSWYDVTGHFSMSPHNDTYVYSAFSSYPRLFRNTNIMVQHNALQNLRDITSLEAQQWWPTTKAGWNSDEVQNALKDDIARLGELVKQHGL